ncbi:MAG: DUF3768 domain-containing protein [Mesorhizobium sp.]|nr:MAG: DUF3768 domain-containing protein [Mesorhizobium sp.]
MLFGEANDITLALDETVLKTRLLNDDLRIRRLGGTIVITTGISALGPSAIRDIISAITAFDGFTPENDPYGEHDCAVMTVSGINIIWKIDYYDLSRRYHSPDPSDRNVTSRVMTIMRADEYRRAVAAISCAGRPASLAIAEPFWGVSSIFQADAHAVGDFMISTIFPRQHLS